jgi:hypothetical protein
MSLFGVPPTLIRYDLQSLKINNVGVSGIQNISISQTLDATTIPAWGNPFTSKNIYKKPNIEISFSKFISDNVKPLPIDGAITGVSKTGSVIPSGRLVPSPLDIDLYIYNYQNSENIYPTGIQLKDCLLKSVSYRFQTEGFFTEDISFSSHALLSSGMPNAIKANEDSPSYVAHSGNVKRRKDFFVSGIPPEVSGHLSSGHALLSVEVTISFDYGEVPSYGRFYTAANKYVRYPIDVSCTFEVLDRGFYPVTNNLFQDTGTIPDTYVYSGIPNPPPFSGEIRASGNINEVVNSVFENMYTTGILLGIKDSLTIDLGSNNFLTNRERSGGDAGQNNYSTYRYTYKNTTSEFTLS